MSTTGEFSSGGFAILLESCMFSCILEMCTATGHHWFSYCNLLFSVLQGCHFCCYIVAGHFLAELIWPNDQQGYFGLSLVDQGKLFWSPCCVDCQSCRLPHFPRHHYHLHHHLIHHHYHLHLPVQLDIWFIKKIKCV